MSLYRKLGLFIVLATVLPLLVVGVFIARTAEDALRTRIQDAQMQRALAEAAAVARFVTDQTSGLERAAHFFDLSQATEEERQSAALLLYKADENIAVAILVDHTGELAAEPAFLRPTDHAGDLAAHPRASDDAVQRLLLVAPRKRALDEGIGSLVLSPVYGVPERADTAMAVAIAVKGPQGALVYCAEFSFNALIARNALTLVDGDGRIVAAPDRATLTDHAPLFAALKDTSAGTIDGVLAARAPVPVEGLGWSVIASLPEKEAFAPVARMRATLVGAVLGVVLLLLGVSAWFVRRVRRGLGAVVEGAEAFARGNLAHKIAPPSEKELFDLAVTFNGMGDELLSARARLEKWNEELEAQVQARTRELKDAQAKLIETQKLAAVGQLGAGVAHEINNPLATVLGSAQNLLMKKKRAGAPDDDPEVLSLQKVEKAAKRVRDVTGTLLRFSQRSDERRRAPVAIDSVVNDAAAMSRASIEELGATLQLDLASPSPQLLCDASELVQVLVHLLSNARTALLSKPTGVITVRTERVQEEVVMTVEDDGKGIDPAIQARIFEPFFTTKDVWSNLGLGLSVSFRLIEEHGGTIRVDSEPGRGTKVTVRLPCA